jgi:hypothetical protein
MTTIENSDYNKVTATQRFNNGKIVWGPMDCHREADVTFNTDISTSLTDEQYNQNKAYFDDFFNNPRSLVEIGNDLKCMDNAYVDSGAVVIINTLSDGHDNIFGYIIHINDVLIDVKKLPNGPVISSSAINNIPTSEFAYQFAYDAQLSMKIS